MISVGLRNKYQDFYNYLLLVRGQRESSATTNVQRVGVLLQLITELSAPVLENLFVTLKSQGKKNVYINKLRETARLYCHFLQYKGIDIDQSIFSIKKLKEEAVMRATMSDSEIEAFLNLPAPSVEKSNQYTNKKTWSIQTSKKGYATWTLFFSIMAYSGMRPNEVARLTPDLVDFGRDIFIITEENSKTHTLRFVPIAPNIKDALQEHVKTLKGNYLFPSRNGGNSRLGVGVFSSVQWGYNFHTRCKRLGIKRKGLCPYSLRHSLITRLLEEDVNIFKVQKIVGHRRLDTTAAYTHMTTKDIQLAISKHPLIRKATDPQQILSAFKEIIRSFEFEKNAKFVFNMNESNDGLSVNIKLS